MRRRTPRRLRVLPVGALVLASVVGLPALLVAADQEKPDPGTQRPVSPQEIEQLRRQILQEVRSSVELNFDDHGETGNLNHKLSYERYGLRLNWRWRPERTLSVAATRTRYRTIGRYLTATGTNLALGFRGKLGERVDSQFEIGATRFTTKTTSVSGFGSLSVTPIEKARFSLSVTRSNVEESFLSAAGVRPALGPFAEGLVGAIMENRVALAASWRLPARADLYVEAGAGDRRGRNVATNFFKRASAGLGLNLVARGEDRPLSLLRVNVGVDYFGFDDNRLGFGGASLLDVFDRPIPIEQLGSDGILPGPSAQGPGVGGYFSPARFVSRVVRVDVNGRPRPEWEYRSSVFLGGQEYTDSARRRVSGASVTIVFHKRDRFSVPVAFVWDDYGPFSQHLLSARLVFRF